jgi:hypothetical protein
MKQQVAGGNCVALVGVDSRSLDSLGSDHRAQLTSRTAEISWNDFAVPV